MNKEAQDADDGVTHVIDKEHVHHHCFVASGERPLVPHKTHEEDQLVEELKRKKTKFSAGSDGRHLQKLSALTLTVPNSSSAGPRPRV